MSSDETKARIKELAAECESIELELVRREQFVASYPMEEAVNYLRKTLSLWNDKIVW